MEEKPADKPTSNEQETDEEEVNEEEPTTDSTARKGEEQDEAALLLNLSKPSRLAKPSPTARTEHWEKVLEANPVNKERLPPLLASPPQPNWEKALEEAKQKALVDFALQRGSVPDGIQKFCSLLPSCIGTYQPRKGMVTTTR